MIITLHQRTRAMWVRRAPLARGARASIAETTRSVARTLTTLTTLPPHQFMVALYGLLLVEAYLVATIGLTVLTQVTAADALVYGKPADQSGLVFLATILVPSLMLGARWLHREATAYDESERGEIDAGAGQRGVSSLDSDYRTLHLSSDAPLHIAEAAYIAAMKRAHPDVPGGSNAEAARLTLAIEAIRATVPVSAAHGRPRDRRAPDQRQ